MKFRIKAFENDIVISDSYNSIFIVKDNKLFAKICLSLNDYSYHLNDKEEILNEKNIEVINDIVTFDVNSKSLISLLYSKLESTVESLDEYEGMFSANINSINSIFYDALDEFNIEFEYDKNISTLKYIKSLNVKFTSKFDSLYDKIIYIFEIYSELLNNKCLIFINTLNYFDTDQINNILKYKNYKKLNVLFIENYLSYENIDSKIFIIDEDYYEYCI